MKSSSSVSALPSICRSAPIAIPSSSAVKRGSQASFFSTSSIASSATDTSLDMVASAQSSLSSYQSIQHDRACREQVLARHYLDQVSPGAEMARLSFDAIGWLNSPALRRDQVHRDMMLRPMSSWRTLVEHYTDDRVHTPSYFEQAKFIHGFSTRRTSSSLGNDSALRIGRLTDAVLQQASMATLRHCFDIDSANYLQTMMAAIGGAEQIQRILDVGCGVGGLVKLLKEEHCPQARVDAMDISPEQLAVASTQGLGQRDDIHLMHGLAENNRLPDDRYDLVTQFYLCHELPADISEESFAEAYRVLKPGGYFFLADMNQSHPSYHELSVDPSQKVIEPYLADYLHVDIPSALQACGFEISLFNEQGRAQYLVARKPPVS